jgi:hypothetical protein
MAGSLSYVILAPIFGKLIDAFSLSTAYLILGAYFLVYGLIALSAILLALTLAVNAALTYVQQRRRPR